jgi:shikimate kinase
VVKLGVEAAYDAKVTVTGAFDDACASYFGGAVVTDNLKGKLLKRVILPDDLKVLFHVPFAKSYTGDSDVDRLQIVKPLVKIAYDEAVKGNYWVALSLNGIIYSSALGYDTSVALDALAAGALAAGLCGKGPAVTAVVSNDKIDSVRTALQRHEGEFLQARLNHEKTKVL